MFCGPFFRTLFFQNYIFVATTTFVLVEGLLTQLVFEHSLRIRVKAEHSDTKDESVSKGSIIEEANEDDFTIGVSRTTSDSTVDEQPTAKGKAPSVQDKNDERDDANILGKINNLVTTDLANIVEAREFVVLRTSRIKSVYILTIRIKFCL